ncbi:MAG: hypothetical protein SGPRY_010262 [Prymnesium sp.]
MPVLLESSAVLAVVIFGFNLNLRRSAISPEVLDFLHEFYEVAAFMFNTIIFNIAGFKLGLLFVDYSTTSKMTYAWALYPAVLLTRGVAIGLLLPLLRKLGTGCSWRVGVAVWWAGLRGSISLALGLVVFHTIHSHPIWGGAESEGADGLLPCRDIPRDTLYIVCVIVTMTVCVNGTSVRALLRLLGLDVIPDDRRGKGRGAWGRERGGWGEGLRRRRFRKLCC